MPEIPMQTTQRTLEGIQDSVQKLVTSMPSPDDRTPMPTGVPLLAASTVPFDERQVWWRKVSELCAASLWCHGVALQCKLPCCVACNTSDDTPRTDFSAAEMAPHLLDPVRDAATDLFNREDAAKRAAADAHAQDVYVIE